MGTPHHFDDLIPHQRIARPRCARAPRDRARPDGYQMLLVLVAPEDFPMVGGPVVALPQRFDRGKRELDRNRKPLTLRRAAEIVDETMAAAHEHYRRIAELGDGEPLLTILPDGTLRANI